MKFHLDEHLAHAIARGLQRRGLDVTTTTDADLIGASDEEQLDFAKSEGRVLVTNDADFLELVTTVAEHSGVAYCAPGQKTVGEMVRFLCLMHDCLTPSEMVGRIEYF
ncbi:MAG: DUF5615 family PIN-like protein [Planctomycetes bacterium]|nr:DUF5615 family PIN-like protein [Planctomycetota bacterium]